MLAALEGCIEGYESLHTQAYMLQRDVSIGNLMMNEEDDKPSWRSFLRRFPEPEVRLAREHSWP